MLWFWLNDESHYIPYTIETSHIINTAYESGSNDITINIMGYSYSINFITGVQINVITGGVRKVLAKNVDVLFDVIPLSNTTPIDLSSFIVSDCPDPLAFSPCPICYEPFTELPIRLNDCTNHYFHMECIQRCFERKNVCPVCNTHYGVTTLGSMPDGRMICYQDSTHIIIHYLFEDGYYDGVFHNGTCRIAYLEVNPESFVVLRLLQKAFMYRKTFTIGTSLTTGETDCIVWNGIHHKTTLHGGVYGFPDPTYITRVTEELRRVSITN